jgi:ferric hydroxamate transport system permease protein
VSDVSSRDIARGCLLLCIGLSSIAGVLTLSYLHSVLGEGSLLGALLAPATRDVSQLLVHQAVLPRIAMAVCCGAALGLSGVLVQQVLRNPLAEPMTLGIFPGAYLALALYTLLLPDDVSVGRELVALLGGGLAILLVLLLAWPQRLSPLAVILSGMVVNLYCGAICLAMALVHFDLLLGLQIWGGGSLEQSGWTPTRHLMSGLAGCGLVTWLIRRPLSLLDSGEGTARSLGVHVGRVRLLALLLAVLLTALVVAQVGVIGFLGLAAPTLARLLGARTLTQRLCWTPCIGAALLWATDQIVLMLSTTSVLSAHLVPTGTVTSLLGVPLLVVLLPRLKHSGTGEWRTVWPERAGVGMPRLLGLMVLLLVSLWLSFMYSRSLEGWRVARFAQVHALLFWQLPQTVAAAAAGGLLALAGALLQRTTANPMASPDLLGVSAGGGLGVIVLVFAVGSPSAASLFFACLAGSLSVLGVVLWFARKAMTPARLLLAGIAVSAWFQAIVSAVLSSGDSRAEQVLQLLMGSTYYVTPGLAWLSAVILLLALALLPLFSRWLNALSLGEGGAASVGVPVRRARVSIVLLAGVLTATATLLVGPLSFVGLLAPHVARLLGARRLLQQLWVATLFGALLMVLSEWLGRQWLFPQQMPAGLVATLVGGPYLIVLMLRQRQVGRCG